MIIKRSDAIPIKALTSKFIEHEKDVAPIGVKLEYRMRSFT